MVVARSIWAAKSKLALAATALGAGAGAATIATSDDPATSLKLCTTVPVRLFRLSVTAATIAFDYQYSLLGLSEESIEKARVKHEVHTRSAHRLVELCFKNGGIYIKLGQHIGQLEYLVPQEYIKALRESMLNRCPTSSYDQVCQVVKKELGGAPKEIFEEFDPVPIASASLAQVHVARTHQGQKVAVKVQHMHMTDTAAADYATVALIVNTLHWLFPSFDYRWLVDEVNDSLPKDGDTFVDHTQYEQLDGDSEDDSEEVEIVEPTQKKAKKEGKQWSVCWQYFEKVYKKESDGVKKKHGKCKHCKKLIKADPIKNGTSGLKKHLKSCEVNPEVRASKQKQTNLVFNKDTSGDGGSSVNIWRHDEPAIKEALLDFFVCAEVPFKLVEHWAFVRFVNRLNGKFKLPSRHKLAKDIAKYYIEERSKLFVYLSDPNTTVHLTTDTWTSSCQKANYMVVTAHFIDEKWVMHKRIINFRPIESHKGDDIGFELLRCINGWGIQNVMTITLDNASSNDKAIEYLLKKLPNLYDKGKHVHVRCMAHILNLIVKDGLFNQAYHVEGVQKAIRYIRHSTQRITRFRECMKKEKLESQKFLCIDCPTRWNSTYEMLKIAVDLQKVFSKYESVDPSYERDLERIPDRDDFKACEKVVQFLEKFKDKTETVSATSRPLSHLFVREVLDVDNHLRVWDTDVDFCYMVSQMREKYEKYWGKFDKLNDYFYFAVILDPTMKLSFVRHCFRAMITNEINEEERFLSKMEIEKKVGGMVDDVESRLEKLFETYQARFDTVGSGSQEARNEEDAIKSQGKNDFFANYLHVEGHTSVATETELIRYIHEPKVNFKPGFDILKWWSLNGNRFPIVARMARDILAIQISSVASESAFSTGGRVLDPYRTRLSTNIVEALICTQDWVRKSSNSIFMDQVDDILNDDDIAIEIEEAINNQKDKGKEQMCVEE